MADYYELIAQAITGLGPDATSERRQALYERAQMALLNKLRSVDPPFTEAEIARERMALDQAVRRVEDKVSQGSPEDHPPSFPGHATAFNELATDAEELGETTAEDRRRHYLLQAYSLEIGRMANPSSLDVKLPSMVVTGDATGILSRIWRWRSRA